MVDQYGRNVVHCIFCGAEIGRGEIVGFKTAICALCQEEREPQFIKENPSQPDPVSTQPVIPLTIDTIMDENRIAHNTVGISAFEKDTKKKKAKRASKNIDKIVKGLTWNQKK